VEETAEVEEAAGVEEATGVVGPDPKAQLIPEEEPELAKAIEDGYIIVG
jgi:hypothetical protein